MFTDFVEFLGGRIGDEFKDSIWIQILSYMLILMVSLQILSPHQNKKNPNFFSWLKSTIRINVGNLCWRWKALLHKF